MRCVSVSDGQRERLHHRPGPASTTSTLRRFKRSTQTPANGASRNVGICPAKPTTPSSKRGAGEAVDQPARRDARHPGADQRDALPAEEEPEVGRAQSAPGVRDAAGLIAGGNGFGRGKLRALRRGGGYRLFQRGQLVQSGIVEARVSWCHSRSARLDAPGVQSGLIGRGATRTSWSHVSMSNWYATGRKVPGPAFVVVARGPCGAGRMPVHRFRSAKDHRFHG